jgi:hypothetical protein
MMPNGAKNYQMAIIYASNFHCKTLQNLPNWDFWFENMPSGKIYQIGIFDLKICLLATLQRTGICFNIFSSLFIFSPHWITVFSQNWP